MTEEILRLAKLLGEVGPREDEALRTLCIQAEAALRGRLRLELTAEACEGAFVLGCAWLALGDLALSRCAEPGEGFSAGGLTVRTGSGDGERKAEALRRRAETVMAPFLREERFAFRGVRG